MADTKISGLTEGGTLQADDYLPAVRAGANVKVSLSANSIGFQLIGVNTTAKALDVLGHTAIGKGLVGATTTAAAQTLLEATPVGLGIFKAATTAAQQTLLEGGVVGIQIWKAGTTAAAQNLLEATTPGLGIFKAATTAAQQTLLEATTPGLGLFKAATTAAQHNLLEAGAAGLATFKAASFARNSILTGDAGNAVSASPIQVSGQNISGFGTMVQNKTDSYSLVSADTGSTIVITVASAAVLTCPKTMPVGYTVEVIQGGASQITFTAGASAAVSNRQSQTKTAGQHAACRLVVLANSDGSNAQYNLAGDTGT